METSQKLRVLVIDDEKSIRRFLRITLDSNGYNVFEASSGAEALQKSVLSHPDLILLDLGLPDISGIEVLHEIRGRSRVPVIIITASEDIENKLAALDSGADDYLTKPFDSREILARLRAVMRRLVPIGQQTIFKTGKLVIDVAKHKAEIDGRMLSLTPKEYSLLKILVLNVGVVLTHRHLLTEVWDKSERLPNDLHLLRVTIKSLRDKIEPVPTQPRYILNVQGVGYRFADAEDLADRSRGGI